MKGQSRHVSFFHLVYICYQGNDLIFGYLGLSESILLNNLHLLKERLAKFLFSFIHNVKEIRKINKVTEFKEWSQQILSLDGIIKNCLWPPLWKTFQNPENVRITFWNQTPTHHMRYFTISLQTSSRY